MLSAAALLGAAAKERPWWSSRMKQNKAAARGLARARRALYEGDVLARDRCERCALRIVELVFGGEAVEKRFLAYARSGF